MNHAAASSVVAAVISDSLQSWTMTVTVVAAFAAACEAAAFGSSVVALAMSERAFADKETLVPENAVDPSLEPCSDSQMVKAYLADGSLKTADCWCCAPKGPSGR